MVTGGGCHGNGKVVSVVTGGGCHVDGEESQNSNIVMKQYNVIVLTAFRRLSLQAL